MLDNYLNKITCGDSREILPKIMPLYKERNCVIVSDPPFNISYHYNEYKDDMKEDDYLQFMAWVFSQTGKGVIIHYPETLYKIAFEMKQLPERVVSWVYNSNTPRQHRDIAFFGVTPDFTKVKQPYKNLTDKRIQERIKNGFDGCKLYDWWEINQVKNINQEKWEHPCQMPLEVMERIIGILPENSLIIEPFAGTATTCVACKNLNRDFIGIEISKEYCEIARNRLNGQLPSGQTSLFLR